MQRWNPCENVLGVNNVGDLGVKWSYDTLYFSVNSSPTVANGVPLDLVLPVQIRYSKLSLAI